MPKINSVGWHTYHHSPPRRRSHSQRPRLLPATASGVHLVWRYGFSESAAPHPPLITAACLLVWAQARIICTFSLPACIFAFQVHYCYNLPAVPGFAPSSPSPSQSVPSLSLSLSCSSSRPLFQSDTTTYSTPPSHTLPPKIQVHASLKAESAYVHTRAPAQASYYSPPSLCLPWHFSQLPPFTPPLSPPPPNISALESPHILTVSAMSIIQVPSSVPF